MEISSSNRGGGGPYFPSDYMMPHQKFQVFDMTLIGNRLQESGSGKLIGPSAKAYEAQ
jgi:hypothetical protein